MNTMYIVDGSKLSACREAAGLSRTALAARIIELSGGAIPCSYQKVTGWEQAQWRPLPEATPFIQAALNVSFDEIAKPVDWPENLPKVKKAVDRRKKIL